MEHWLEREIAQWVDLFQDRHADVYVEWNVLVSLIAPNANTVVYVILFSGIHPDGPFYRWMNLLLIFKSTDLAF